MSYTLSEIRVAAYNWHPLPNMTARENALYQGLGYCYEWYRANPGDKDACDALAKKYVQFFGGGEE